MGEGGALLCYPAGVRRTSLEINEERLAQAQCVLGTAGIKDTVDRALEEVLRADLRRRLADRTRSGEGVDLGEELLEASRRWQD